MRRFSFKLERLLKLREHAEKDWETRLGKATSRCTACIREIRRKNESHARILAGRSPGTGIQDLVSSELYMLRMREEAASLRKDLQKFEKERAEIQKKFLEASKERKILQKLKERKEQEFYREQKKDEMKALDDLNTGAAARKAAV